MAGLFPPNPSASAQLVHNLLGSFDPKSYTVATASRGSMVQVEHEAAVRIVAGSITQSNRLDRIYQKFQAPLVVRRLVSLIRKEKIKAVLAVYPDFEFLKAAREAARITQTPWVAYLHDTVAEALEHTPLGPQAAELQRQVFEEASHVLVMSEGMADLYRKKYQLEATPLEHTYPEAVPSVPSPEPPIRQAFWSGSIYGINAHAVSRISEALDRIGCPFYVSTPQSFESLRRLGIKGDKVERGFAPTRAEYLSNLQKQAVLLLALDGPGESSVHHDELATIFSTKTPEYLAAARPILAHCPEDYFLARFIKEHGCGVVVSEPSVDRLAEALGDLLDHPERYSEMRQAALRALERFLPQRTSEILGSAMDAAGSSSWGKQVRVGELSGRR